MEKKIIVFLIGVIIHASNATPLDSFSAESERFSLRLYSKVAGKSSESVVLSPVVIQTAIGLLYQGAGGGTADDISAALNLGQDKNVVANSFQELFNRNAESDSVTIVNKIFLREGVEVKPEFSKIAAEKFQSEVENVDFANAQQAAEKINSWVEAKTRNEVQGVVGADDVTNLQSIVVNTLHFRGTWQTHLSSMSTVEDDFWVSATETKKLPMMRQKTYTPFGEFDDFKAVQLPFRYSNFSFVLLVPNDRDGVKPLEARFAETGASLRMVLDNMKRTTVQLNMPKFKAETKTNLGLALRDLGLSSLFSDNADFSNLSATKMKIDKVIHKAVIDIDEYGIDGSEASGILPPSLLMHARLPPKLLVVDHPFLYFIVDSSGHIFFAGRFVG